MHWHNVFFIYFLRDNFTICQTRPVPLCFVLPTMQTHLKANPGKVNISPGGSETVAASAASLSGTQSVWAAIIPFGF